VRFYVVTGELEINHMEGFPWTAPGAGLAQGTFFAERTCVRKGLFFQSLLILSFSSVLFRSIGILRKPKAFSCHTLHTS